MNQLIHQDSGTSNLQQFTSNTGTFLPKQVLWFWLSWGDLIIMPLIMVMLSYTLQSINFNMSLDLFQIHTPLLSNKMMIIKLTNSWNSSTQSMMMIFWVLTSIFFKID